jgi:hypothetical protein
MQVKAEQIQITRQSCEGKVRIKRKTAWVDRYAQIKDALFQYKEDRYSIKARFMTDLRKCEVRKGKLDGDRGYFQIKDRVDKKAEVIMITFENNDEFNRWGQVFMESMKSDQELKDAKMKIL